jgi:DNA-binding transcriptional ArsR family regulator
MKLGARKPRMLACLGDASRFRLVAVLSAKSRCVTDLARDVGLSQSCTTRHLQALKRVGLVCAQRAGKRVMYHLCSDEPQVVSLLSWALAARREAVVAPGASRVTARSRPGGGDLGKPAPTRARARARPAHRNPEHRPVTGSPDVLADVPAGSLPDSAPQASPTAEPVPEPAFRRRSGDLEDFLL